MFKPFLLSWLLAATALTVTAQEITPEERLAAMKAHEDAEKPVRNEGDR